MGKKKKKILGLLERLSVEVKFSVCLDSRILRFSLLCFPLFYFFFFFTRFLPLAATVHVRYMNSSRNIWPVFCEQYICVLFTDPQILFFINFFIKNGSQGTIYTFKNYFATVISAISFQFQQNKSYPNRHLHINLLFFLPNTFY